MNAHTACPHHSLLCDLPRAVRRHCPAGLRQQSDDIAQSAAASVLARGQRHPSTEMTSAYVRRAARNAVIDIVRKVSRRERWWLTHATQMTPAAARDPERLLIERQLQQTVAHHLAELPAARREVVTMYLDGHGITEIADKLGCNRKRADNLVRRGLATLRQALLDEGVMAA